MTVGADARPLAGVTGPLARSRSLAGALNGEARAGLLVLLPIVLLGALVPALGPYDPTSTAGAPLLPPGVGHLLGTDDLGRDVLTRTLAAARVDILMALVGVSIPLCVGTFVGALLGTTRSGLVSLVGMMIVEGVN